MSSSVVTSGLVIDVDPGAPRTLRCASWSGGHASEARSLRVTPDPRLPVASASVDIIALPSTLEWLDAAEAYGLLLECHRLLAAHGRLILALPDAEAALAAWRNGDASERADPALAARTAATCCTFRSDASAEASPPPLDAPALAELLARWTPFRLAIALRDGQLDLHRERILSSAEDVAASLGPPSASPTRQLRRSAWSRAELTRDLQRAGFTVRSFDDAEASAVRAQLPTAPSAPTAVSAPTTAGPSAAPRLWCVATPALASTRAGLSAQAELRECQAALALEAGHAFRHYRLLWARFARALAEAGEAPTSPSFQAHGYAIAQVPWSALAGIDESLSRAERLYVTTDDFAPGYAHNDALSDEAAAGINTTSCFLRLGAEQRRSLVPVLQALCAPMRACFGTGFRVINARSWRTPTSPRREEPQSWHKDELFPRETVKAMIYLSPAGGIYGSTELAIDDVTRVIPRGPPGTVLIFRNGVLTHRGVAPSGGERHVLELTLAPWPEDDLHPRCAGLNAEFNILPWAPLEGM
jgi:SAM-dependent methyltransferase